MRAVNGRKYFSAQLRMQYPFHAADSGYFNCLAGSYVNCWNSQVEG